VSTTPVGDKLARQEKTSGVGLSVAFFLIISVFFLAVNYNTPLIGEDFALSPLTAAHQSVPLNEKIVLIGDKIINQSSHWNARLGEQLAIFFLGFHKDYFNFLNSFVAIAYFYTIFLYAFGSLPDFRRRRDIYPFIISFALVIFLMPAFGEMYFWTAGACNYLWACELILIFGLPYRLLLSGRDILSGKGALLPLFCLLGFLAGMSSENSAVVIDVLIMAIILYSIRKRHRLGAWIYCGAVSLSAGIMYLYFVPSTKLRLDYYNKVYGVGKVTLSTYFLRARAVGQDFMRSDELLIVLFTVLLLFFFFDHRKDFTSAIRHSKDGKNINADMKEVFSVLFLLSISLISIAILVLPPYHEQRSFLLTVTMLVVATVKLFSDLTVNSWPLGKKAMHVLIIMIFSITIFKSFLVYREYSRFDQEAISRDMKIKYLSQEGIKRIKVKPFLTRSTRKLNTREDYINGNVQYFIYYGVDNIKIE
jgi:Family of unknown function (DUF6056)